MAEIRFRLFMSLLLGALIKGSVAISGHSIEWLWAMLVAVALVFGGWLIIGGDVID